MKNTKRISKLGTIALLLGVTLQQGWAQGVTAALLGAVTDPSGAPISGAKVTATDVDRGTKFTAETNSAGSYNLPQLPIGAYTVSAAQPGFQTAQQNNVVLVLNQVARVDFHLAVGTANTAVTVMEAPPLLQTQSTTLATVMDAHAIGALPLETRNYNQLTLLTPGAITTSPAAFNTGQQTFNSGRPYINGNREQANYYLLDGMDNNEFVDNNVAYSPNVDAIQEFNVVANNPSAEYGQFLGGVISVSTKSGTNQFHGNLFEYLRNDFFNANEWSRNFSSDPSVNSAPANLRWNQFGGTFGGPVKRNKLFFFVDYQGSRFDTPATVTTITTFTNQELSGNLSDIPGIQLHYPGTTIPMPANLAQANICGANQKVGVDPCIPGLSKTALAILGSSFFPKATLPGTLNNALNSQHTYTNGDQGDAKVDYNITDKDHLFVRYSQQYVTNPTTNSQPLLYNSSGNNTFPLWNGVVNYTRTISPNLINEARFGVNYYPAEAITQSVGSANAGSLIPGEPTGFLPGLAFLGAPVGGAQNGPFAFGTVDAPELFHQTTIQFEDTATMTHGAHVLHFGFQALRYRNNFDPTSADGAAGQIIFNGSYTGNAEADFLLGLPSYMGLGTAAASTVGQRNSSFGAFAQDDWRVNAHLTLNFGLRWQLFTPIYEVDNRMTNFNEVTGAIELAGINGNSRALYNQYNGIANFLPRIGAAWTPWGNSTVLRAGFSRSSFQEGTGEYNRLVANAPWNTDTVAQFNAGTNGAIPAGQITLDQGFTGLSAAGQASGPLCNTSTVASSPASCFAGQRVHLTDPNYRPAVSNQWNVAIQHQFGNSTTVQIAYVGQHTDHLADILFANQKLLLPNGTAVAGPYLSGNPTLKNEIGQARLNETTGVQNYNALQLTAQRRLASGLQFQANYTWSKCLTDSPGYYGRYGDSAGSQASADKAFQEYVYNLSLDYGYCDHDVTNVFNGFITYDLPFGKGRMFGKDASKAVNALLGDWQFNTIFTVHGGFPISLYDFSDPSGTGSAEPRPNCIAPSIQTPYKNFSGGGYVWFDPSTVAHPAPGTLGNCGVGTERGPGLKQVDISLSKQFRIGERQSVEFRAEAINAFNTPIFVLQGYSVDVFGGSNFGVVNTSAGARNLQFALKYRF
jgi:Carboxypeptidase regulatory-like domain/TonB dependent receptor